MKRGSKNIFMIFLMASSLALLIVLQALWLVNCYQDEKENFRKGTAALFRSTLLTMHDQIIEKSIEPIDNDTITRFTKRKRIGFHETLRTDAIADSIPVHERDVMRVEVFIASEHDSIEHLLRPLVSKIHERNDTLRKFIFRLADDSLRADSVRKAFKKTLEQSGIDAEFDIISFKNNAPLRPPFQENESITEVVRLGPVNQYGVTFSDINALLLSRIIPQLTFSFVLTALVIASFYMMYRHLVAQQRLMEEKNNFISNITHELKTPVATVSVALEALKDFKVLKDEKKTGEYLDIAQHELSRLTLMTDKILKMSILEHAQTRADFDQVDLDALVADVLKGMKVVIESSGIHASYVKNGSNFHIKGSKDQLATVIYNLIDNSIKYRKGEGAIDILLMDSGDALEISVRDNGVGIADEHKVKIFEKFFRVPQGDVHNIKGYGLGLSYVQEVVKLHKGTVEVESEVGHGSKFVVRLPRES